MQVNSESVNNSRRNASGNFVDTKSARDFSNQLKQQFDLEFADVTLSNLRPPQASSTVERKVMRSTGTRFTPENSPINDYSNCWSERQSEDRLLTASAGESSLGLIDVSTPVMKDQSKMNNATINIETERELARQLLLRCSQLDNNPALYDTNKENNVNIQNLSATEEVKTSLAHKVSKFNSSAVSFEPTEFTGRSSIINEDGVTSSTSVLSSFKANNSNAYGFSFNSTAAELMEKFGNDDFLSGSQFDNKLLTDELSWRQNYDTIPPSATTTVPVASTNCVKNTNNNNNNKNNNYNNRKEHLNLTCFSGIIGELDLSLASCATVTSGGRKVSVGEYFKRKCDPLGQLSNSTISSTVDRPNFGLHSIRSPERIASYKSPVNGGEMASTLNGTVDVESESFGNNTMVNSCDETQLSKTTVADDLMSLSKIAQVLQSDELGGSPRRLIDQLLMLKKKQKSDNLSMLSSKTIMPGGGDTYTVLPARTSLPVMNSTSSTTLVAGASDNDVGIKSNGLLFDNNSVNGVIKKDFDSFNDKNDFNNDSDVAKALFPSTKDVVDASESYKNSKGIKIIKTSILSTAESPLSKYKLLNHNSMQNNVKQNNSGTNDDDDNNNALLENIRQRNDQYQQQQQQNNMVIKEELDYTNDEKRVSEKISIGKNTRDLYKCFIGVPRDADIEIKNESDRWLICTFKLDQIQGNKNNVEIIVPSDQILIEPNESKTAKLMVNFLKVGDPVMASLSIQVMDMSTREIFTKQHMMCFIPTLSDEFKNQDLTCISTLIPTTTQVTEATATATANGDCHHEIELIDATPVLLKSNTNKYIRLKNKTNKMVNLSVAVKAFDKLPEDNFNIEPKNLTLQIDEMSIVLIKYHNSIGIKLNDRQAVIKIKTDGNTYSYSAVLIENEKNEKENEDAEGRDKNREEKDKERESNKVGVDNENNDYCQRCNTPQRMMFTGASGTGGTRAGSVELGAGGDIVNDAGLSPSNNILSPASTASTGTTIVPRINLSGRNSPRSTISTTTSNTGGSRPPTAVTDDVIIPIKSTNSTLVWTTVKVGKYENREFTIRNIGSSKIKLQGVITDKDNCYKFLKDRDLSTNMTVTLQRMESKTFTVIFNPSSVGPAAGKITFTYFDKKQHQQQQQQQQQNNDNNNKELSRPSRIIPLYGYGGYAKVCVGQALKIIGDQMWLPLGKLNSNGTLNTKIRLENTGDLSAYAKISLAPKAVYPSVESNWHIEPTEVILAPKEVQWITLRFRPRREDMALLRGATASGVRGSCGNSTGNVTDIATLTIMHGDEPTRWRIRRLYKKITQAEQVKKSKDSKDIFMSMVHQISKVITGEKSINNLNIIRDSVQDLSILCRQLLRHAITLTMEWDSDDTMSIYQDTDDYYYDDDDDSNESKLFQSLYSASEINNSTAITVTNENNSYYLPSASETRYLTDANYIMRANNNQPIPSPSSSSSMQNPVTDVSIDVEADKNKQFTVSPLSVTLSPPILKRATVIITNMTSNNQPYRTKLLSHSGLVSVVPSEGIIPARRGILVKIQSNNNNSVDKNIEAVLRIYTANEKRDLAIKILTAASVPSTGAGGASAHERTESGS
ncbi:spindle defective 2 isoform X1 [Cotesia typhae]|uniref:spindle defective 2 isoform X1 n=1 Tax=Cotesia typhae TaxID=2053667 RepID=UPI003D687820